MQNVRVPESLLGPSTAFQMVKVGNALIMKAGLRTCKIIYQALGSLSYPCCLLYDQHEEKAELVLSESLSMKELRQGGK